MDQSSRRLPSLRDIMGSTAPQSNTWTAINRPEGPGSVSPHAQHSKPQVDGNHPPLLHRQDRQSERPTKNQEPAFTSIESSRGDHSPRSSSRRAAGKPITPERQDSFLLPSVSPQPATIAPQTATSLQAGHSPETNHHTILREPVIQPLTPPSDPSSTQTHPGRLSAHSSAHNRQQEIPPMRAQKERDDVSVQRRERHSDLTRASMASLPQTALFENESYSMPPPPVPTNASSPQPVLAGTGLSSPSSGASQTTSNCPADATNAEKESHEKCAYCNASWTFPPLDMKLLHVKEPSTTLEEMQENMEAVHAFHSEYIARKNADYAKWKLLHYHCTDPHSGNKRKPDEPLDDGSSIPKIRKGSSESSPRNSRLTPPPEQAVNLRTLDGDPPPKSITYKSEHGAPVHVSHATAMLTGIDGAPRPPPYVRPANDSNNMWHDMRVGKGIAKVEGTAR